QHDKYKERLPTLMGEAKGLVQKAKEHMDKSHHAHLQADRLDYGHLGAEIGIVLCSLSLLTKRRVFWLAGLGSTVLAIALVVWASAAIRSICGWSFEVLRGWDLLFVGGSVAVLLRWVKRAGSNAAACAWFAAAAALFYPFTSEFNHCQRDPWMLLPAALAAS